MDIEKTEDCYSECGKKYACNFWTHDKSTKKCLLKYTLTETQLGNSNMTSGPKTCNGKLIGKLSITHWLLLKPFIELSTLRKAYCGMSLDDKRTLLESFWVTGEQVESLLASVGYVWYLSKWPCLVRARGLLECNCNWVVNNAYV